MSGDSPGIHRPAQGAVIPGPFRPKPGSGSRFSKIVRTAAAGCPGGAGRPPPGAHLEHEVAHNFGLCLHCTRSRVIGRFSRLPPASRHRYARIASSHCNQKDSERNYNSESRSGFAFFAPQGGISANPLLKGRGCAPLDGTLRAKR